jgi:WD40 repeat protein
MKDNLKMKREAAKGIVRDTQEETKAVDITVIESMSTASHYHGG